MAVPTRQLLSQTSYNGDGATTVWDFSFAGGYLDQAHVKASKMVTATGVITQIPLIPANFIGAYQVSISPAIPAGTELTVYRDTPKSEPLVNFADKAALTEAALDLNAKQAIFVAAESSDGLATAIDSVAQITSYVDLALGHKNSASAFADASYAAAIASEGYKNTASQAKLAAEAANTAAGLSAAAANDSKVAAAASAASIANGPVASFNGRAGVVVLTAGDVTTAAAAALALKVDKTSDTGSAQLPAGPTSDRPLAPLFGATRANSTLTQTEWWNGSAWVSMGGGATGAPGNNVFIENDQVVTANYTLTAGKNAVTAGPISINTGVIVTIPTGATWTVV